MHAAFYLHFPFCVKKCRYCDFCSAPGSAADMERYIRCLCVEIRNAAELYPDLIVDTLFFGGGTPSVIPLELMQTVVTNLRESFTLNPSCEFTSEANPGTLSPRWIDGMVRLGMNRLSIGVQAVQDELLARIGRIHSASDIENAAGLAREAGINNLNMDTMYGLPGQTKRDYLETLDACVRLGASHISAYSLILEEGTSLYTDVTEGREQLPDEDSVADMEEAGIALLEHKGFRRYEISNFARQGFRCEHNIRYWQDGWYLGLGLAAHSMLPARQEGVARTRFANTNQLREYCDCLENGGRLPRAEIQGISPKEARFETIMLATRMTDGVSNRHFEQIHGVSLLDCWGGVISDLVGQGLGELRTDSTGDVRFALTSRGLSVQNSVVLRFVETK